MASLRGSQRHAAAAIFDRLVTPSGSKIAYNADDLRKFAGKHAAAVDALLEQLSDRHVRILRAVAPLGESPQVRYEIFHDVLSNAVLNWRAQYLRDRNQKRVIAYIAVVVAVAFAVLYWVEKQRDARDAQARAQAQHEADVLKQISDLQAQLNAAKGAPQDPRLLQRTAALYANIGDVKGRVTTLRQLGDTAVENRRYHDAITAYDDALKYATSAKDRNDLQAKKIAALAGAARANGDAKSAAEQYRAAATLFTKNGQAPEAASMLTKAATAAQDADDFDGALASWQSALKVQQQLGDTDGQARSLRGIDAVTTLKLERGKHVVQWTVPVPMTGTTATAPCELKTIEGYWYQLDRKSGSPGAVWRFELRESKAGTSLHVGRKDGLLGGDFVLQRNAFAGTLRSFGEEWKDVQISVPDQRFKCDRVETTNLPWYFARADAKSAK